MKSKVLALACFLICGSAIAQNKEERLDARRGIAPATPPIEDVLAADNETFGVLFLANPGNAQHFKLQNNHLICINCLGGSADTVGARTVSNPAQTRTHCISAKTC